MDRVVHLQLVFAGLERQECVDVRTSHLFSGSVECVKVGIRGRLRHEAALPRRNFGSGWQRPVAADVIERRGLVAGAEGYHHEYRDRKSTRLNSSHLTQSRMPA